MPRWPEKPTEPKPGKRPKLAHETRAYTVTETELSEWLTETNRFFVKGITVLSTGDIEFTVTTEKQAERVIIEQTRTVNEARAEAGLPPVEETGPAIVDDEAGEAAGVVGTADPVPAIAPRNQTPKARLKSRREMNLEARKAGLPETAGPRITDRDGDEDDPVPSALPR